MGMEQLLPRLTEEALAVVQRLHRLYGERLYKKVIQLERNSTSGDLLQLESELLSGRLERLLATETDRLSTLSEGADETMDHVNEDLDFLDALASHDFRRLNKFSSGREHLGTIFSEIVENEQQTTSNFQNEVFEKNIQRIFNEDVELEDYEKFPESRERLVGSLSLEKNMPATTFLKQLGFFSFYEKSHVLGTAKSKAYYMSLWLGMTAALMALVWFLVY